MTDYFIGIDIGTGSSKGVLVEANGYVVAQATRSHKTSFPKPGYAEHDAEQVWWHEPLSILRELVDAARGKVAGVAFSGIGPCMLPATADGRPLRPAILYGVDTRSYLEIEEVVAKYGSDAILEKCGNNVTSQSVGPKWLWVKKNEPEIWEQTKKWFMAHTYMVYQLTGAFVLDHPSASMCEPLYSPYTADWIPEWCEDITEDLELPALKYANEIAGEVTEQAARLTGLEPGTPVMVGTVDGIAEALSVGVREPGDVMLMYGSTVVVIEISDKPMLGPNLWSCVGAFDGTSFLGGGLSTSGSLTTWVRDMVGSTYEQLMLEAAESGAGSRGLVALPYFSGERSPIADPDARGLILGLNLTHTRGDLYRSMLEASAYGTRHVLDEVKGAGGNARRYVAVGGGTTGGLWPQIMSDVIKITQEIPKYSIGASYGDALLAAIGSGKVPADTQWNEADRVVEPIPTNFPVYDELYRIYRELYPATVTQMHAIAELQR